jgi:hypothetical protein
LCPLVIVHKRGLDTEFFGVHPAPMDIALAALHKIAHDTEAPAHLAWVARVALNGREPTAEDDQALGDAIDVALYVEELDT